MKKIGICALLLLLSGCTPRDDSVSVAEGAAGSNSSANNQAIKLHQNKKFTKYRRPQRQAVHRPHRQ